MRQSVTRFDYFDGSGTGKQGTLLSIPAEPDMLRKLIWIYYQHSGIPVGGEVWCKFWRLNSLIDEIPVQFRPASGQRMGFAMCGDYSTYTRSMPIAGFMWNNSDGAAGYAIPPFPLKTDADRVELFQNFEAAGNLRALLVVRSEIE